MRHPLGLDRSDRDEMRVIRAAHCSGGGIKVQLMVSGAWHEGTASLRDNCSSRLLQSTAAKTLTAQSFFQGLLIFSSHLPNGNFGRDFSDNFEMWAGTQEGIFAVYITEGVLVVRNKNRSSLVPNWEK